MVRNATYLTRGGEGNITLPPMFAFPHTGTFRASLRSFMALIVQASRGRGDDLPKVETRFVATHHVIP